MSRDHGTTKREILRLLLEADEQNTYFKGKIIAETLDIRPSTVSRHLTQLDKEGLVKPTLTLKGYWRITELGRRFLGETPQGIGMYGSIAAGPAIPQTIEPESFVSLPDLDARHHVAFRVQGNSMEHCHIYHGDTVIVRLVNNTDLIASDTIVAVLVPDENNSYSSEWDTRVSHLREEYNEDVKPPLDHITLKVAVKKKSSAYARPSESELLLEGNGVVLYPSNYQIVGILVRVQRDYINGKLKH